MDPNVDDEMRTAKAAEEVAEMERALAGPLAAKERFALELMLADTLAYRLGDSLGSLAHYGAALQIARERGLSGACQAELGIGQALQQQGRPEEAIRHLEAAVEMAACAQDRVTQAAALALQGDLLTEKGQHEEAIQRLDAAQRAAQEAGERGLEAQVVANLALLQAYFQRFDEAEEMGRRSLALAKESGDVGLVAIAYLRMGQVMHQQDRYGPAYYWFKAGANVAGEAGLTELVQFLEEAAEAMGVE